MYLSMMVIAKRLHPIKQIRDEHPQAGVSVVPSVLTVMELQPFPRSAPLALVTLAE